MEDYNQGQPTVQAQGGASQGTNKGLEVSQLGEYHMTGIAKWVKIIAVIGTIMMLALVVLACYMLSIGGPLTATGIAYLVAVLIYIYPLVKSYGISKHFKAAVYASDSNEMERGLSDMRGLATFMGVLSIIGFIFTIIGVIGVIVAYNKAGSMADELFY